MTDHLDPAALIISAEFVEAARVLGATNYRAVAVAHPVQPLTRHGVRALADRAFEEVRARLTA